MKVIVLAAGYGTRMQGIIGDMPKALVEVGGRTILDLLMNRLDAISDDADRVLVTNDRFHEHFATWRTNTGRNVVLLNDGSTQAENRLGAVADIRFAVKQTAIDEDVLVVAADTIFDFDFSQMVAAFDDRGREHVLVAVRHNPDMEDQKRRGVAEIDDMLRIVALAEKPSSPRSHWAAAPLYIYPAARLADLDEFVASGGNVDAPGHFIEYLVEHYPVYGWQMPGGVHDVGNPTSLAQAREQMGE